MRPSGLRLAVDGPEIVAQTSGIIGSIPYVAHFPGKVLPFS
jgi:hypothetical protein